MRAHPPLPSATSSSSAIAGFLDTVSLAPRQSHKLLTLWPLLSSGNVSETGPAYVALADAIECGALEVRERKQGASVPLIELVNHGGTAVLVLFGEELRGALQNRIANASFLVPAHDTLEINVSCVEQGRWGGRAMFRAARSVVSSSMRRKMAAKVASARSRGRSFDADQSEVWSEVGERLALSGTDSRTSSYEDYLGTRRRDLDEAARAFRSLPGQVGFVAAIGDQIAGVEAIGRQAVFARAFDGLLRAYLIDAVDAPQLRPREQQPVGGIAAGFDAPEPFLAALAAAPASEGPSLGLGRDVRLRGGGVAGCALVLEPAALVHLTAFADGGLGWRDSSSSRCTRFAAPDNAASAARTSTWCASSGHRSRTAITCTARTWSARSAT